MSFIDLLRQGRFESAEIAFLRNSYLTYYSQEREAAQSTVVISPGQNSGRGPRLRSLQSQRKTEFWKKVRERVAHDAGGTSEAHSETLNPKG